MAQWHTLIADASARFDVPQIWISRVIQAESAGQIAVGGQRIRSRAGAMGLMQLMPKTWEAMRALHRLGDDPDDPADNILAGTAYLRAMYDRFGYPGLFAAYNAGPARYSAYLEGKRGLPAETIAYIAQLSGDIPATTRLKAALREGLFSVRKDQPPGILEFEPAPTRDGLFAVRRSDR